MPSNGEILKIRDAADNRKIREKWGFKQGEMRERIPRKIADNNSNFVFYLTGKEIFP